MLKNQLLPVGRNNFFKKKKLFNQLVLSESHWTEIIQSTWTRNAFSFVFPLYFILFLGYENRNKSSDPVMWAITESSKSITLSSLNLLSVPAHLFQTSTARTLQNLDLSRNKLTILPKEIGKLTHLVSLNISRNAIRILPAELGACKLLEEILALSNALRPLARSIPVEALASLCRLRKLDLRYNKKLKRGALDDLRSRLNWRVEVLITLKCEEIRKVNKTHACDRDASKLQSQLEPISTPRLRARLQETFGVRTDPEVVMRPELMRLLLQEYARIGPRTVLHARGELVQSEIYEALLGQMRSMKWPKGIIRERQTVKAEGYIILRSPLEFSTKTSAKARMAAVKLQKHSRLWSLAQSAIESVDPIFAKQYTAIALTKNFSGSPHIDTQNVGPFYGLALGEFAYGTGALCVEVSPTTICEVDTKGRLAKVDGRFVHWVGPCSEERYSVIFYRTLGKPEPHRSAMFVPFLEDSII